MYNINSGDSLGKGDTSYTCTHTFIYLNYTFIGPKTGSRKIIHLVRVPFHYSQSFQGFQNLKFHYFFKFMLILFYICNQLSISISRTNSVFYKEIF